MKTVLFPDSGENATLIKSSISSAYFINIFKKLKKKYILTLNSKFVLSKSSSVTHNRFPDCAMVSNLFFKYSPLRPGCIWLCSPSISNGLAPEFENFENVLNFNTKF